MLPSLFVVTSLYFTLIAGYQYYPGPLSFDEAKAFCENIGSHLATIVSDNERIAAILEIEDNAADVAWIGLEHDYGEGDDLRRCFFHYPAEEEEVCSLFPDYKCVPFWVDDKPHVVLPPDDDNRCAAFYPYARNQNGGVNNDVSCDTQRGFLCHDEPEICTDQSFTCGYGPPTFCEPVYGCGCVLSAGDGSESRCVQGGACGVSCNPANGNDDCGEDSVCVENTCCYAPVCMKLCGEDASRRRMSDENSDDSETPCTPFYCPDEQ